MLYELEKFFPGEGWWTYRRLTENEAAQYCLEYLALDSYLRESHFFRTRLVKITNKRHIMIQGPETI